MSVSPSHGDISVEEAQAHLLDAVTPTIPEQVPLVEALNLVLAADVVAPVNLPPFDTSSVDGYAVKADDTRSATLSTPVTLTIAGEAPAGFYGPLSVESGSAIRIMTGARVPAGTTAIVPFESTDEIERDRNSGLIRVFAVATPGDSIRPMGSGIRAGTTSLRRGQVLRPAQLGTVASLGLTSVSAHRRPRIALLTVGSQFVAPGGALGDAQTFEANEIALVGAVRQAGGIPVQLGIAGDQIEAIGERISSDSTSDVVVVSGGVAHGAFDVVKEFLQQRGRVVFWRVAMRPGRPCGFGWFEGRPVVSLAGNPGAALVGFEQFLRPVIRKLLGRQDLLRPTIEVAVTGHAVNVDGRRLYLPARVALDGPPATAQLLVGRGLINIGRTVEPNALVIVPESVSQVGDGDRLRAQLLSWDD
jgi:molybdopterin molybdotransferase